MKDTLETLIKRVMMKDTLETIRGKLQDIMGGIENVEANLLNGSERPLRAGWLLAALADCIGCLDKTTMPFEQFVVIDWHDTTPWIERFVSENPITIDEVVRKAEEWDFNEDRDSITFVDPPNTINATESDDTVVCDTPIVCVDSPDGQHKPNWDSVYNFRRYNTYYCNVLCAYCNAGGRLETATTPDDGVQW